MSYDKLLTKGWCTMKNFFTFFLLLIVTINVVAAESHYIKVDTDERYAVLQTGHKKPTLIFLSSAGDSFNVWDQVIAALLKQQAVFAYNRAGIGGSTPLVNQTAPRTAQGVVTRLRKLLKVSNVSSPYVLVAHGIGSLYALYFARAYPNDVQCLVLIEPNVDAMLALSKLKNLTAKQKANLAKLIQQINYNLLNEKRRFIEYRSAIKRVPTAKESRQITIFLENLGKVKSQKEIDALAPLKNMPIVVLSSAADKHQYNKMQRLAAKQLAKSVKQGSYVEQVTPDAIVAAIKKVL